jgi:hypothetical protein
MSTFSVPYTFVNGTVADGTQVNANFSAIVAAGNNINASNIGGLGIYAANIIPTTITQGTFGGTQPYTFNNALIATPTSSAPTTTTGTVWYDQTQDSLSYFNSTGFETNIGQEVDQVVYNGTGSTLNPGQAVYISGAGSGAYTAYAAVSLAVATSTSTANAIGVVGQTIANGSVGMVVILGRITNVNTTSWTAGQTLYLDYSTAGNLITTQPTSPYYAVRIGFVIVGGSSSGSIFVSVRNVYTLGSNIISPVVFTAFSSTSTPLTLNGVSGQIAPLFNVNTLASGGTNVFQIAASGAASFSNTVTANSGFVSSTGFTSGSNSLSSTNLTVGSSTYGSTSASVNGSIAATSFTTGTWNGSTIDVTHGGTGLISAGTSGNVLTSNGTTWVSSAATGVPSGAIVEFATTTAPSGYLLANGASYSQSAYPNLYTAVGLLPSPTTTTYFTNSGIGNPGYYIGYANGYFFFQSSSSTSTNSLTYTANGSTLTTTSPTFGAKSIAWNGNTSSPIYVVVDAFTDTNISYSTNLTSWTHVTSVVNNVSYVFYSSLGYFYAVGSGGLFYSTNGATWTAISAPSGYFWEYTPTCFSSNGSYVTFGIYKNFCCPSVYTLHAIVASTNGTTFSVVGPSNPSSTWVLNYSNGYFFASYSGGFYFYYITNPTGAWYTGSTIDLGLNEGPIVWDGTRYWVGTTICTSDFINAYGSGSQGLFISNQYNYGPVVVGSTVYFASSTAKTISSVSVYNYNTSTNFVVPLAGSPNGSSWNPNNSATSGPYALPVPANTTTLNTFRFVKT